MELEEENIRSFNVELTMYRGYKITLGERSCVQIHFKDCYFYVMVFVGEQKTLSSTKPTYATLQTLDEIDDFDILIKVGQKFYLKDHEISKKVGTGHILEILPPE